MIKVNYDVNIGYKHFKFDNGPVALSFAYTAITHKDGDERISIELETEYVPDENEALLDPEEEKFKTKTHLNSLYGQMCYQDTDSIKEGE